MNNNKDSQTTIVYVNFKPYENAGNILDYLLDTFQTVLLFSFNFHRITDDQQQSRLIVYKKKKIVYQCRLFQTPTNSSVAFILLPIRSVIILLQLLFHLMRLQKSFGPYSIYFTVNAFTAWSGNILRTFKIVRKTVFWVWDYYPPIHKDKIVMFMRWLYWIFDKPATIQSDKVVFLNQRLVDLRKRIGVLPKHASYPIIPIGTNPHRYAIQSSVQAPSLVFLGVIKKSQGLDLIFSAVNELKMKFPKLTVHIFGGGPDENYFRQLALDLSIPVIFHGYIHNDKKLDLMLSRYHIGIAPYQRDPGNVSYYSDPSKIKRYLSCGLPVITTDVFQFSREIQLNNAGIVIRYSIHDVVSAVQTIMKSYLQYRRNSMNLGKRYAYQELYRYLFSGLV